MHQIEKLQTALQGLVQQATAGQSLPGLQDPHQQETRMRKQQETKGKFSVNEKETGKFILLTSCLRQSEIPLSS